MPSRPFVVVVSLVCALVVTCARAAADLPRAPAVPLVPVDPYFSVWSPADHLSDADTQHWTEAPNRLTSLVRVDGKTYRLMGAEPKDAPPLPQTGVEINPTTVTYTFEGAGVRVALAFFTPLLPEDLDAFSRPVTYLSWRVEATDRRPHTVQVEYDNRAELAVDNPGAQQVEWASMTVGGADVVRVGSVDQPVLGRAGDQVRIDWGYQYVAVPHSQDGHVGVVNASDARAAWDKALTVIPNQPTLAQDAPVLAARFDLGRVTDRPVTRWLLLAYDDVASARYFGADLKGYWTKDGADINRLITDSVEQYDALRRRGEAFDRELMEDLTRAGGPEYAWLCALSYRQSIAASKLVADANGQPLWFCKENSSNGCMGTVDVFYPQAPLPLLFSPTLSKAMLVPVLDYASSDLWKWPNAPHDVGTWPHATGQVYGGSDSNGGMPVEESANMLLLVAAVAHVEGNADFAGRYWPVLTRWMEYLERYGRDPENQLCTDDFAGHLAHNANLAAKAICAIGAYAQLAEMRGETETAKKYADMARDYARAWMELADDGDHYRLAYDRPGTWSCKYNLVWDRVLGLDIFPPEVVRKEMAFYRKNIDPYGLALDGRDQNAPGRRARWTKADWAVWTACLTGDDADFMAITRPLYRFYNEAERRVGLSDLYFTDRPDAAIFKARPVMGGVFIRMLCDADAWSKWASRDQTRDVGDWAPLPKPPVVVPVVAPASVTWRYTTRQPAPGWESPAFDDSGWRVGPGGFGTRGTPGAAVNTLWDTPDIWLRGEVNVPAGDYTDLRMYVHHDEDAEIYVDGRLALRLKGYSTRYETQPPASVPSPFTPGRHSIAVRCHQTGGGQYIDVGFVDVRPAE